MTGLLTTAGLQFQDWSAPYRLFARQRLPTQEIFAVVRHAVLAALPPDAPLCVALDDTLLRKTGAHAYGVAYRRDPLGPHFQTNFVRAQRFLQLSAAMPQSDGSSRMVPLSLLHAPTPAKPRRSAPPEAFAEYRKAAKLARISALGAGQIAALRHALDADPQQASRRLLALGDGGYTNATVLKHLPSNTTFIGRIRKDAKLCQTPASSADIARGRPRRYGPIAPTPEQFRIDDSVLWESLTLSVGGLSHTLRYRRRTGLMWRAAGVAQTLQLIVIAPLAYRLRKGSKLLYRDPAFLICTDPALDAFTIIQSYIRRWGIEVNFREEKTLLGVGQAQVRTPESVAAVPALMVASYAMLLVALARAIPTQDASSLLPSAKWHPRIPTKPITTQQGLHQLRAEVWSRGLGLRNFSDFAARMHYDTKAQKSTFPLESAVLYANN